jgi:hypothetical protein
MGYTLQKPAFSSHSHLYIWINEQIYKSGTLVNKEVSNFTLIDVTSYQMSTETLKEMIKNGVFAVQFHVESQQVSSWKMWTDKLSEI